MSAEPRLLTERLTLRRWSADDLEPFAALNADPDVMRYFRGPLDRAASDAFVERIEAAHDLVDEYRLMVFPVLLGSGKRLWSVGAPETPARLTVVSAVQAGDVQLLVLHPKR